MKFSTILYKAANEWLWAGGLTIQDKPAWSCQAITYAANKGKWPGIVCFNHPIFDFIRSLGCDPDSNRMFDEIKYANYIDRYEQTAALQNARYLWLMFAYQVALDEGI